MNFSDWTWGLIGVLLSIMVLSYLIKDNFLFRLATQVFVGLTAGYFLVLIVHQVLLPNLIYPLGTGTWLQRSWMIVPLVLSLLLILGQIPCFSYITRYPIAFVLGLTTAIVILGAVFGTIIPQTEAIINAFDQENWFANPDQTWVKIMDAVIMLVGAISVLGYFHFGRKLRLKDEGEKQKRPAIFEGLGKVGQVFIGMTLGAVFAGIFSSSLWALIDRVSFVVIWAQGLFKGM
jgi:CBS domain containing-hemolysin-like protein